MQFNPNEAPEGYVAVKGLDCTKCAFINDEKPVLLQNVFLHVALTIVS